MKRPIQSVTVVQSLLLALLLPSGCGLGTEVGNGAKEEGKTDKNAAANNEQSEETPESSDTGAPGEDSATDGSEEPGYVPPFDFDLNVLTAACASPFGDDLASPVSLASIEPEGERNRIDAEYEAEGGIWKLMDLNGATIREVIKSPENGPYAVTAADETGAKVGVEYTCTAVQDSYQPLDGIGSNVLSRSTVVSLDERAVQLTWYLDDSEGAPYKLLRIEIDDVDGEGDAVKLDPLP